MFTSNIEYKIVWMLAKGPKESTPKLLLNLNREGMVISKAQFYKLINKLLDNYVIIKEGGILRLNELWLKKLERFLETTRGTRDAIIAPGKHLLNDGESKTYYVDSMLEQDRKRSHLAAQISSIGQHKNMYATAPHLYHILRDRKAELYTYQYLLPAGGMMYDIIKGDSFMDNFAMNIIKSSSIKNSVSMKLIGDDSFIEDDIMTEIMGDYIITTNISKTLGMYFKQFFHTVTKIEDFDSDLFNSIFKIKSDCRIVITRDEKKANILKKKIKKYF